MPRGVRSRPDSSWNGSSRSSAKRRLSMSGKRKGHLKVWEGGVQ
eukprot:gene26743-biopygen17277